MNQWKSLFRNRKGSLVFLLLAVTSIASITLFTKFLVWNERREGVLLNDFIQNKFLPIDFSLLIAILTNGAVLVALSRLLLKPVTTIYVLMTVIISCIIRGLSLYFVVLEPPPNIIPLRDPIMEVLFYDNQVLLKDLFFSGHTANILLFGMLLQQIKLKRIIITTGFITGILLIIQHVHYTIDVVAAPVFALIVYKISIYLSNKLINQTIGKDKLR